LVCERFTPFGLACVLVLAGTGLAQGAELIGSQAALFGTPYGQLALLKVSLFAVALVLAALNRLRLTDRLASGVANGRRLLLLSVGIESLIGLAIVNAAAFMASSPSPAHTVAVLPSPAQPSLTSLTQGMNFGREVILGSLFTGAGTTALVVRRRLRRTAGLRPSTGPL
jgi:hypothetical protein